MYTGGIGIPELLVCCLLPLGACAAVGLILYFTRQDR